MVYAILYTGLGAGLLAIMFGYKVPVKSILSIPRRIRLLAFTWLILYIGMGLWFGRIDKPTTLGQLDSSAMLQIGSIAFCFCIVLLEIIKGNALKNFNGPLLFIAIYALLGVITAPISPVPALSLFKASSLLIVVILAVVAVNVSGPIKASRVFVNTAYLYLGLLTLLAVVGGVLFPAETHRINKGLFGMMLVGWPALNSNSLSFIAAILCIVSIRRFFEPGKISNRIFYSSVFTYSFCVLLLAQGRTSIIALLLAILMMTIVIPQMRWLKRWIILGVIFVSVLIILSGSAGDWLGTVETYMRRGSTDESLRSLSGRTEVWSAAWDLFLKSPILGYGYYSAEKLGILAHNAYLLVLVNSGVVGFLFWIVYVYWSFFGAIKDLLKMKLKCVTEEQRFKAESSGVLIVLFLRTLTGSDLTMHHYSTMVLIAYLINRMALKKYNSETVVKDDHDVEEKNDINTSRKSIYEPVKLRDDYSKESNAR